MAKRKVIFVTQYYDPEPAYKGQAFIEGVICQGWDVVVLTAFPNYPNGKLYAGYRQRFLLRETKNGVRVHRVPIYPSHSKNRFGRVVNYLSFSFSIFIYLLVFGRRRDIVHVYHPPLTVGLGAAAARIFRRFAIVLDVHDLWPDTLAASGMLKSKHILKVVNLACQWLYRRSDRIVLHTEGFRQRLLERKQPPQKLRTVLGWGQEASIHSDSTPVQTDPLPGLRILYAGNLGAAQALHHVIEAAALIRDRGLETKIGFYFLGSGALESDLKRLAKRRCLRNVRFIDRVSQDRAMAYLAWSDVLLVHLKRDPLFEITIPSKIQSYLFAGKPILEAVGGEASGLVKNAGAGISAQAENSDAIAAAAIAFMDLSVEERLNLGQNGHRYYMEHLSRQAGTMKICAVYHELDMLAG